MWKILLISSLVGLNAYADKRAHSAEISAEQQDEEKYAVAKGNPQSGDPVDEDQCLSDVSIHNYEKASVKATDYVLKHMRDANSKNSKLRVLHESLISAGLLKDMPGQLGIDAKDAGRLLQQHGFVNLMQCPEWTARLKNSKNLPLGAVLVYEPLPRKIEFGSIRMKTSQGCVGLAEKAGGDCGKNPGYELIGVYVKNVN
jgi:hypothetical protein